MGPCIVSIFQYISNNMQRYTVYLYLETALHISGGTSTHHQERIQLYLQHLVFVAPSLLSAAIVEELEPVWVCCGWRTNELVLYKVNQYICLANGWMPNSWRNKNRRLQWILTPVVLKWAVSSLHPHSVQYLLNTLYPAHCLLITTSPVPVLHELPQI
jgi:hypothetical protein